MANSFKDAFKGAGMEVKAEGPRSSDGGGDGRRNPQRQVPDERRFHNPYHFVPVKGRAGAGWIERERLEPIADAQPSDPDARLSHARYFDPAQGYRSGRILCRLEAEGPFFVGARRSRDATDTTPDELEPFELEPDIPAIPASSLRGLISSLAEAASGSALRVLHDGSLSYRREMGESLSALGMIVEEGAELRLFPLTLPTLEGDPQHGYRYQEKPGESVLRRGDAFLAMFPIPRLKIYAGDYTRNHESFLKRYRTKTYRPKGGRYHYLELVACSLSWTPGGALQHDAGLHRNKKWINKKPVPGPYVLGQQSRAVPCEHPGANMVRGILRVLGKADRDDIPNNKKHEVFIPYPEGIESDPTFRILPEAICRFHDLADERAAATWDRVKNDPAADAKVHPYHPLGSRDPGERRATDGRLRLRAGDIVYFNARMEHDQPVVDEVAFSAIWRGRVENGSAQRASVHSFFSAIDPELLPFHKDRQWISPAEQVFGFVQRNRSEDGGGLAYRGRVRLGFGRVASNQRQPFYDPAVTLKVLDSPKPPSPGMYFKRAAGSRHIPKKGLKPHEHFPQGRKLYLHHKGVEAGATPWKTEAPEENAKQKVRIAPIRRRTVFYFHLDFDNLSEWELGLVFYALRPNQGFRHKLGMGKSLGLGTVRIDPVALFLIDRLARYGTDDPLTASRYHRVRLDQGANPAEWPDRYATERAAAKSVDGESRGSDDWKTLRDRFAATMDRDVAAALAIMGDPSRVKYPVHTPQVWQILGPDGEPPVRIAGREMESKTYRWFVANDRGSVNKKTRKKIEAAKQALEPLSQDSPELPWLERYDWAETDR